MKTNDFPPIRNVLSNDKVVWVTHYACPYCLNEKPVKSHNHPQTSIQRKINIQYLETDCVPVDKEFQEMIGDIVHREYDKGCPKNHYILVNLAYLLHYIECHSQDDFSDFDGVAYVDNHCEVSIEKKI